MISIYQSSKEERIKQLNELFYCHNGDCDNCGMCKIFKGTSVEEVYHDYIEGLREFSEISREFNQKRI